MTFRADILGFLTERGDVGTQVSFYRAKRSSDYIAKLDERKSTLTIPSRTCAKSTPERYPFFVQIGSVHALEQSERRAGHQSHEYRVGREGGLYLSMQL